VLALRVQKARYFIAARLQAIFRGNRDRAVVRAIKEANRRQAAAIIIQKLARQFAAKKTLEKARRYQKRAAAAIIIQKHIRARLARDRVHHIRKLHYEEMAKRNKAAVVIQKVYRGHKARVLYTFKLRAHQKKNAGKRLAVLCIQRHLRGFLVRRRVQKMKAQQQERLMDDARAWVETWSEDQYKWFYYNAATGEALWEPPPTGYTKAGGMLVLANGKIIQDPLNLLTEEEKELRRLQRKCVECEERDASRFCNQCQDKYCSACYSKTHAGGKRAAHTYAQIGPIDCSECDKEVSNAVVLIFSASHISMVALLINSPPLL